MPKVKQFDRQEVLIKAMMLFWKKGYHATSIQDLVDYLSLHRGSIYDTYGGKKKLFDLAIKNYTSQNYLFLCDSLTSDMNVRQTFKNFFRMIIQADIDDEECKGCFVVNTTTDLLPADSDLSEIILNYKKQIVKKFHDLLQKGVESGEISSSKNIKMLSELLYTLMTGLRVVSKTGSTKNESLETVDAVLSLLY